MPLTSSGSRASSLTEPCKNRLVASLTRIVPGSASLLKAGGQIGRIPDGRVVPPQLIADPSNDNPSGIDPHADFQFHPMALSKLGAVLLQQPLQTQSREHGPARVVLVGDGRAEKSHEAVAEELIDRPLVAVDFAERQLEEPVEQEVHRLGAQAVGERRRAHQIAEEDGDLLALPFKGCFRLQDLPCQMGRSVVLDRRTPLGLDRLLPRGRRTHLSIQRRAAVPTELESGRALGPTLWAGGA